MIYAQRKAIGEPVNGQIKEGRGLRRFLLRRLGKVDAEWDRITTTHNLLQVWRHWRSLQQPLPADEERGAWSIQVMDGAGRHRQRHQGEMDRDNSVACSPRRLQVEPTPGWHRVQTEPPPCHGTERIAIVSSCQVLRAESDFWSQR